MSFQQSPPSLGNQYEDDGVLRSYLARVLPETMLREIEPSLREMGRLAGGDLYQMQLADRLNEPTLTQWDAWGNRIDHVEVTPLWREAERIAVDYGLVATAYEQRHGSLSRVHHQCALAYLFTPSTDIYSCPLAMTDGAARTLLSSGNQALIDRAVPHLTTRNPEDFWTAGQWMTELTGGSDVGLSQTRAVRTGSGPGSPDGQPGWGGGDRVEGPLVSTVRGSDRVTGGARAANDYSTETDLSVSDYFASDARPFQTFKAAVTRCRQAVRDPGLTEPVRITRSALAHAETWLAQTRKEEQPALEAAARRFAMTLGRTMELALLIKHAQWSQDHEADGRATAAARRFANSGVDLLVEHALDDVRALVP